jgi:hypothetical protein
MGHIKVKHAETARAFPFYMYRYIGGQMCLILAFPRLVKEREWGGGELDNRVLFGLPGGDRRGQYCCS